MSDSTDKAKAGVIVLVGVAVITAGYFIITSIMEALNLKDTPEEKQQKQVENRAQNAGYFDETFLTTAKVPMGQKILLLTDKNSTAKAKGIYDSIGVFTDDPQRISAIFDSIKTQSQVTSLAIKFKRLYNKQLLDFLRDKLDTDSQKEVLSRILSRLDKLPKYNVR